ncbi:MAG: hypothetical protein HQL06_01955 [Nitrospirae bacterium]|nr:hypothetical protein [Nitrospirota bacterium]
MLSKTRNLLEEIDSMISGGTLRENDYLTCKLCEYSIILFHAEVETRVKSLIYDQTVCNHVTADFKKTIAKGVVRALKYSDIRSNFQDSFWNNIEEFVQQQLSRDDDFERLKEIYSNIMAARNEISHAGETQHEITLRRVKDAVRFCEYIIEAIRQHYR